MFEKGHIVEDGIDDELLAKRGAYYRLCLMQVGGFLSVEAAHSSKV
ncbi:hypothetical protein [Nostoc sp.]